MHSSRSRRPRLRVRWTAWIACYLFLIAHGAHGHALGPGKPLRGYGQQSWQSDAGLPQNTVRSVLQTRDGYLWIATEAGLVRFDGNDFTVFDTENTAALRSDLITCLSEDGDGSLWIGTSSGLVREREGRFSGYGPAEGLPSSTVLALYLSHRGQLLALTAGGAAAFELGHNLSGGNRRFVLIPGTEHLGLTEGASLIVEDEQDRLWIAGREGVAFVEHNTGKASTIAGAGDPGAVEALATTPGKVWVGGASGLAVFEHGPSGPEGANWLVRANGALQGLPSNEVTSLLAAPGGSGLWIGTGKGLAFWSRGSVKPIPELAGVRVQKLYFDRGGTLWVASTKGLARITDGRVDFPDRKPLLTGVLAILEDREGSMWFGTDTNGLHVLRDQPFSTLTTEDGLSASLVRAVFQDHAGTMWIGTSGGGLDRFIDGHVVPFTGRLPSKVVLALAETEDGATHDLWVGTPEGLTRLRDGQMRVFTTADGLADDFVRSLYADRDGSLWVGTRNGLSHYQGGVFHSYSKLDGLASDLIGTILRGNDGTLWVGTLGGLSRMSGEGFASASALGGLPDGAITALLEDGQGSLWVGVNGRGLSRLRPSHAATSYAAANLPTTIYGMLEDAQGDLWLSSRTGIDRVSIAALDAYVNKSSLAVQHYDSADGMRISEASGGGHPAAWRAADGGLWFATLNGASIVHPRSGTRNPVPPLSAIEQVLVDEQPVAQMDLIRVAPGHGSLSIKYAGLSFVSPQRVRYRYMLKGFDKNWADAGTRRTAFYTNVPPGPYTFLVSAANTDGVWSLAPAEQRFTVEPYFYQTGWFYALVVLGLAGLGYLVYHWRVLTVEAQYRAVLEERSRIAREIHDTLAQGYVAIAVQLELAERLIGSSTDAVRQQLKQTREMVREGLAEARSSIWNLRAQTDAKALTSRLAAYVASQARRVSQGTAIKFTVHGAYRPLARSVEEEVMRIAEQSVANAVAHAQATCITVTLNYDPQLLELRVVDDGVGMSAADRNTEQRGHFGLQGMQERADRIGASLAIESAPGLGLTVLLQVDLRRTARPERTRLERE